MKKQFYLFVALFISVLSFSQVIPLRFDEETYGYATVSYLGKESKTQYNYVLEIEDINLNKINEVKFDTRIYTNKARIYFNKSALLIYMSSSYEALPVEKNFYYLYDLKTNTLSEKRFAPVSFDDKHFIKQFFPIEGDGFVIGIADKKYKNINYVAIDNTNKLLWKSQLDNLDRKGNFFTQYVEADADIIATVSIDDDNAEKGEYNLSIHETKNGSEVAKMWLNDSNNGFEVNQLLIHNDKIFLFGDAYDGSKNFNGKTIGIFMMEFDKKGKPLSKKIVKWSDLKNKLNINENGFVKDAGYIYTHNFFINPKDEHLLMVGEFFRGATASVVISDMVIFDLDKEFNLQQVERIKLPEKRVDKNINNSARRLGRYLEAVGVFNYDFANEIENKEGLAFFYSQIDINLFKKSTLDYGIVVYKDGKISVDKIHYDRIGRDGAGVLLPNKPGYIMVYEYNNQDGYKKRIEKINH